MQHGWGVDILINVDSIKFYCSSRHALVSNHAVESRRLACSIDSKQREYFASLHTKRGTFDCIETISLSLLCVLISFFGLESRPTLLNVLSIMACRSRSIVALDQFVDKHKLLICRLLSIDDGSHSFFLRLDLFGDGEVILLWLNHRRFSRHNSVFALEQ